MKKQILSLLLTLCILLSIGGTISIMCINSHAQPAGQIKSLSSDKEKIARATCEPPFAASKKSDKYHCKDCPEVNKIKPENLIWFNSACDAQSLGYTPCRKCNPSACNAPVPTSTPIPQKIPTTILTQAPTTAQVGDKITINGTLIRQDTKSGIAGATITLKITMDGDNRITTVSLKTDSAGNVSYSTQVPDPRPHGIQLPVNIHGKFSYDGSDTYVASEGVYTIQVVP
jgi:hypothetical protein